MTVQRAVDFRATDDVIVITFQYRYGWQELLLYDSRTTQYDVPRKYAGETVEAVDVDNNLTIIVI